MTVLSVLGKGGHRRRGINTKPEEHQYTTGLIASADYGIIMVSPEYK
jgi:nitrogen regulatory protein PII